MYAKWELGILILCLRFFFTAIGCPEMSAPMSGSKEGDTFFYGNKIQFSCFPGYKLIGANETECLSSGRWSEEKPECQRKLDLQSLKQATF